MITIFQFINDILWYKKSTLLDNVDTEASYNNYMVCRWLSMYSPSTANLINLTANKYFSVFETKQEQYKFLVNVIPKSKIFRINYIKKPTVKSKDDKAIIEHLAKHLELSQREIRYYIDTGSINITDYKKLWEC